MLYVCHTGSRRGGAGNADSSHERAGEETDQYTELQTYWLTHPSWSKSKYVQVQNWQEQVFVRSLPAFLPFFLDFLQQQRG